MWISTNPLTVPEVLKVLALHQLEFGPIKFEVTESMLKAVDKSIEDLTPSIAKALATPNGEFMVQMLSLDFPNKAFINLFLGVFFKKDEIFVQFDASIVNGKRVENTTRHDRICAAIATTKARLVTVSALGSADPLVLGTPTLLFAKRNAASSIDTTERSSDSIELELSGIEYEPDNKPVEDGRLTSTSSVSAAATPRLYDACEELRPSSPLKLKA